MGLASRIGIFFTGAALLVSISCEKHQVGEYPEVQRDIDEQPRARSFTGWLSYSHASEIFP